VQQPIHQVLRHANHTKVKEHSFYQKQLNVVHGLIHLFFLHPAYLPQAVHSVALLSQVTQPIAMQHVVDQQKAVIVPRGHSDLGITKLFSLHQTSNNGLKNLIMHGG